MQPNRNITFPKIGMNRNAHPSNLSEQEYRMAYNAKIEDGDGTGTPMLQNEPSNILCSNFKEGYKVVGFKSCVEENKTYFFLTNPDTGCSEIGYIENLPDVEGIENLEVCCDGEVKYLMGTKWEETTFNPVCTYHTIISDEDCIDSQKCLNFDLCHPICENNIEFNDFDGCGKTIFWTDNHNPPRYIELGNLDQYFQIEADDTCDEPTPVCLNCDKMRIFPLFDKGCLSAESTPIGGNLKMGVYEYLIAYCDVAGNELTGYHSITGQVSIFDKNNINGGRESVADRTTMSVKLCVDGLDKCFSHYKIAVIACADVDNNQEYYVVGVYPVDNEKVLHTTDLNKERITLNRLLVQPPSYKKTAILTAANQSLFHGGITCNRRINLQPIVSLLGGALRWQTNITTEKYYCEGISSTTKGYMRDEKYPFSIRFCNKDGSTTDKFPFVGRPPIPEELAPVADNKDSQSILNKRTACDEDPRILHWQFYNTAQVTEFCLSEEELDEYFDERIDVIQKTCKVDNVDSLLSLMVSIPYQEGFTTVTDFVNNNLDEICNPSSDMFIDEICTIIEDSYEGDCLPFIPPNCENPELDSEKILLESINNEVIEFIPIDINEYEPLPCPDTNLVFQQGDDDGFVLDNYFIEQFLPNGTVYQTNDSFNTSCSNSIPISPTIQNTTNYVLPYSGGCELEEIQEPYLSDCVQAGFSNHLHQNALWFKIDFTTGDEQVFQVSPVCSCNSEDDIHNGTQLRFNVYSGCGQFTPLDCGVFNTSDGLTTVFSQSDFPDTDCIYVAVDVPFTQQSVVIDGVVKETFITTPPCGAINIDVQSIKYESIEITADLIFCKEQTYNLDCVIRIPKLDGCSLIPYQRGTFSYCESTECYPCNEELWDSSVLNIRPDDIPEDFREEFESYYTEGEENGFYTLSPQTDFQESKIRHFKFPCNATAPFMNTDGVDEFQDAVIFPMGVSIDPAIIKAFLEIAVLNELITQEEFDQINGYEIFVGDRSADKSVIAKGMLYDMYEYEEGDKTYCYPNYPHNDLGEDPFLSPNEDGTGCVQHPHGGTQNDKFSFLSPETLYYKPSLPYEMKIEGYALGHSRGSFSDVCDHQELVLLAPGAYVLAGVLAGLELAVEVATYFVEAGTLPGFASAAAVTGLRGIFGFGEYRSDWLQTMRNNGLCRNYASQYSSVGCHNQFIPNDDEGNMYRGLCSSEYMKSSRYRFKERNGDDTFCVDNWCRENSVFISTGEDCPIVYPQQYVEWDNNTQGDGSRFLASQAGVCDKSKSDEVIRPIGNPYVSLKQNNPDQYGSINSINWLPTHHCGRFDNDKCDTIWGGDVYIVREHVIRSFTYFRGNAINKTDKTPFDYSDERNIHYPKYYVDYQTEEQGVASTIFLPDVGDDFNLDCQNNGLIYVKKPSKFYLNNYGIACFLTESTINTNYRYGGKQPEDRFYPEFSDYCELTQECNRPIKTREKFNYNPAYSKRSTRVGGTQLPSDFSQEKSDCELEKCNAVIYSEPNTGSSNINAWLNYKIFNAANLTNSGKLVDLNCLESNQVLARFTDSVAIFNAIDVIAERVTPETVELGTGGVFAGRPIQFSKTDLGYGGTQHKAFISTEFGHFWVDAKRGEIFTIAPNGTGMQDISGNMSSWFSQELKFKLTKCGIKGLTDNDVDNPMNGLGIVMGYDKKCKRIFVTKRDYIVREEYKNKLEYEDGKFYLGEDRTTPIKLCNDNVFEDCSWTTAYSPVTQSWISYYSYIPDYYISHNCYFQTGKNNCCDESRNGLWSHLLTNQSYTVFCGDYFGWGIEIPVKEQFVLKSLKDICYWMDTRRYINNYDFASHPDKGFTDAIVYNHRENTGYLDLVTKTKNSECEFFEYPKLNECSTSVVQTWRDGYFRFGGLYNMIADECNNIPAWNHDCNNVDSTPNKDAFNYQPCEPLKAIRGDWFLVRLLSQQDSRFKQIFKWMQTEEIVYPNKSTK